MTKAIVVIINTISNPIIIGESMPNVPLCVITTLILNIITTKRISPVKSNFKFVVLSDLVSGVPFINNIATKAIIIDKIKIHLQPIKVETIRSEERRVGKEWRNQRSREQRKEKKTRKECMMVIQCNKTRKP